MKTAVKNTAKNVVNKVATTTKVVKAKKVTKVEKVTYLNVGVTGKQMMKAIYKANEAHKKDMGTFNQCLKRAIEFGQNELSQSIKGFKVTDMTARNIIPLRNAKKTAEDKWSVYEVLMLTKKYYQTK